MRILVNTGIISIILLVLLLIIYFACILTGTIEVLGINYKIIGKTMNAIGMIGCSCGCLIGAVNNRWFISIFNGILVGINCGLLIN